ncbi:unnamed protein product [Caenorhabditis auriculariae]|uniref:Calcineurin-like phosphoesterase domain-containing protein n=1 Tax=Caenorhabditis auriculariae TaxID=2777116 RepID=A0A8S1GUS5_9PELO|nr:unnamed protein product [Caenorhabditis auriculariae]
MLVLPKYPMTSVFLIYCWLANFMSSPGKIDPHSEEDYWEEIKCSRVQIPVVPNQLSELNAPPDVPHLKVVCISDTHEQLQNVTNIPDGDVLIHAGDFTNNGDREQLLIFNSLMGAFPHRHKLVVAGNHELGFDANERKEERLEKDVGKGTENGFELLTNVTYLQDREVEIDGVKFFGSSYHPLRGFPFYRTRAEELGECWKKIPTETDVLITHTPPLGYLDQFGNERWGCRDLLREVEERVKPCFHVFGHVHERYGAMSNGKTMFINAAQCLRNNVIQTRPLVFYIPKKI